MSARRDSARTRRLVLEAAFDQVHRRGFQAASLTEIVAATGLTKGALYHHFPSKKALGYAVVEELLAELVEETWVKPLQDCPDPVGRLKELITRAIDQAQPVDLLLGCPINNLALEMSSVDEGFRRRIQRIYERWRQGTAEALRRARDAGQVRGDFDPAEAALFIVGSLAGCRSLAKNAQSLEPMLACRRSLARFLDGLRT